MLAKRSTESVPVPKSARPPELAAYNFEEQRLAKLIVAILLYEDLIQIDEYTDITYAHRVVAQILQGKLCEDDQGAWELHLLWVDRNED